MQYLENRDRADSGVAKLQQTTEHFRTLAGIVWPRHQGGMVCFAAKRFPLHPRCRSTKRMARLDGMTT